ncbi:MAG TPA: hypothetical protein VGK45_16000 [Thermoanaerobaculia bacterium]
MLAKQDREPADAAILESGAANLCSVLSAISCFAATRSGSHMEIFGFAAAEVIIIPRKLGWTLGFE